MNGLYFTNTRLRVGMAIMSEISTRVRGDANLLLKSVFVYDRYLLL